MNWRRKGLYQGVWSLWNSISIPRTQRNLQSYRLITFVIAQNHYIWWYPQKHRGRYRYSTSFLLCKAKKGIIGSIQKVPFLYSVGDSSRLKRDWISSKYSAKTLLLGTSSLNSLSCSSASTSTFSASSVSLFSESTSALEVSVAAILDSSGVIYNAIFS